MKTCGILGGSRLDRNGLEKLGPEPLGPDFTVEYLASALKRSGQAIKIKLLDQTLVAGVGNIYASEALFRARISPRLAANKLSAAQVERFAPDDPRGAGESDPRRQHVAAEFCGRGRSATGFFITAAPEGESDFYQERLLVYDRNGQPCVRCRTPIKRLVQAARSTFYCPDCQRG